jgi:hypothetical protein
MFIKNDKKFHFRSSVGNKANHATEYSYELNTLYHVKISQTQIVTGNFEYCIHINGVIFECLINFQPRSFETALFYLSDPWYDSFDGYGKLSNVSIANPNLQDHRMAAVQTEVNNWHMELQGLIPHCYVKCL